MPVYEATGDFFALAPQPKHKLYFGASPEELVPRITTELSTERTLSSTPMLSIERYKEK
jgi:isochorismate synthase EntC